MPTPNRGFSLIELLIVIAIIGILASIVLAGTANSRNKAADTQIRSSIHQLRILAESYYDSSGYQYTGLDTCVSTPTAATCFEQQLADRIIILKTEIENTLGQTGVVSTTANQANFCLAAPLKAGSSSYICVSSVGSVSEGASASSPCATVPVCVFN